MSWFERSIARLAPFSYAALRIVSGVLFSMHGAQKVFGVLGGQTAPLASQKGIGGLIELCTGLLVALGLFTRQAAFLASGTMAVAYLQFHWRGQMGNAFWPIVNKGELAVVYCFLFLYIASHGAGTVAAVSPGAPRR